MILFACIFSLIVSGISFSFWISAWFASVSVVVVVVSALVDEACVDFGVVVAGEVWTRGVVVAGLWTGKTNRK